MRAMPAPSISYEVRFLVAADSAIRSHDDPQETVSIVWWHGGLSKWGVPILHHPLLTSYSNKPPIIRGSLF